MIGIIYGLCGHLHLHVHFSTCPNWVLQVSTTTIKIIITHYHSHASFLSSLRSCLRSVSPKKSRKKLRISELGTSFGRTTYLFTYLFTISGGIQDIIGYLPVQFKWWINTSQFSKDWRVNIETPPFSTPIYSQPKSENPYDWNPCRSRGHNLTLYTSNYSNHGRVIHQQHGFVTFCWACHDIEGIGHSTTGLFQKCLNEPTQILMDILCPNTF